MKRKVTLLLLLLVLLLVNAAQAGASASYVLDWVIPLTSGGGGKTASASYTLNYSVGQTAVSAMASTGYGMQLGFWQTFLQNLANLYIWLPVILK
jgi:hypothetical protein